MPTFVLLLFRCARLLFSGHAAVAVENAALRLQLAAFQRKRKRPVLTSFDRLFWVGLSRPWNGWRVPRMCVRAGTVVRWQRERFRRFWARLSKATQHRRGRPSTAVEIRRLIERMASANPLWRAPRIHGELKMLGIEVSERTVSRILRRLPRSPSRTWKTFLRNHLGPMVSIDFFTVPTITMKALFVFIVLEHRRRQVLHFNLTEHPSAAWTSQQIVEAFADQNVLRYLLRDRDDAYGNEVRLGIASLHIEEVLTAPQSPWQNPYAERLIGSIRRDCPDHFVILNARYLKRTLTSYFAYHHESRTHLAFDEQCPLPRQLSTVGRIVEIPQLGGLHHRYERLAAQRDVGGRIFGERQDIVPRARPREIPRFHGVYGVRVSAAGLPETVLDPNLAKDGPSTCKFRLDRQPMATRSP